MGHFRTRLQGIVDLTLLLSTSFEYQRLFPFPRCEPRRTASEWTDSKRAESVDGMATGHMLTGSRSASRLSGRDPILFTIPVEASTI